MNKKQVLKAIATGVVIAELAVLDYAAVNGFSVEVSLRELEKAEKVAESDMVAEGEIVLQEAE